MQAKDLREAIVELMQSDEYKKHVDLPKVATMTCFMEDRNYNRNEEKIDKQILAGNYGFRRKWNNCQESSGLI